MELCMRSDWLSRQRKNRESAQPGCNGRTNYPALFLQTNWESRRRLAAPDSQQWYWQPWRFSKLQPCFPINPLPPFLSPHQSKVFCLASPSTTNMLEVLILSPSFWLPPPSAITRNSQSFLLCTARTAPPVCLRNLSSRCPPQICSALFRLVYLRNSNYTIIMWSHNMVKVYWCENASLGLCNAKTPLLRSDAMAVLVLAIIMDWNESNK